MFAKRTLNHNELAFVSSQINRTKKLLLGMFVILAVIITIVAIVIYSEEDENHVVINIMFGVLIMLLYGINWFVKGYREHVIDPTIYKATGYYERIYEQHGKYGRYYDTINGAKVKIPWHWRKYLKSIKNESFSYEYIVRDGVVAINEGAANYIVTINDTLSLDYEIKNGLKKAKPLSFLNIVSVILIIPVTIALFANRDIKYLKDIWQLTQTKEDILILNNAQELTTLQGSRYIQLHNAWVYQFKRPYDFNGENYVLTQAERDHIYNNPSSGAYYRYYFNPKHLKKPERESFKNQLKNNMDKFGFKKNIDSSLWEKSLDEAYKIQLRDFNNRLYKAKRLDSILNVLKPKTPLFKLYDNCFNAPEESTYSIKASLEKTFVVSGFYNPKTKTILSFEEQDKVKKDLKNILVFVGICAVLVMAFLITIYKIVRNTIIKRNLVEAQLNTFSGPERLER
ncbi:hypothetical protein [Algibacter pectinivorans]|uniref:Uncharacterized protein n=1 Tax=Algibacter pectinivorans TaxID=870482 RepID=A0A1I1NPZ3_9FLAO|nr:hypothetical protein [Algibacter pectinivorans]SFC97568.1 hypothetical protein SAMN04487987_102342 [Algibacter pectinivorans]